MHVLLAAVAAAQPAAAAAAVVLPAPFPPSNGGWFDKERKIEPAAGKKPHIAFILL
jgi:hypothetical protein